MQLAIRTRHMEMAMNNLSALPAEIQHLKHLQAVTQ